MEEKEEKTGADKAARQQAQAEAHLRPAAYPTHHHFSPGYKRLIIRTKGEGEGKGPVADGSCLAQIDTVSRAIRKRQPGSRCRV